MTWKLNLHSFEHERVGVQISVSMGYLYFQTVVIHFDILHDNIDVEGYHRYSPPRLTLCKGITVTP